MSTWNHYISVHTITEALTALQTAPGPACPVAGGTDLLLELQQGHHSPVHTLVDLTGIPELGCLEVRDAELFIGAAVPVSQVTESPLVRLHALAVSQACGLIGGPQVRNTATLGGNVAHALPAADGMIGLVALDAAVEIAALEEGRVSLRRAPVLSLFKGPGQSTLAAGREILVGFYLPLACSGQASAFGRVMRPQGVALPVLNVAVWLEREGETIRDARVAVGPAGPTPQRARAVEDCLRGRPNSPETLALARETWRASMRFRTSPHRATAEYRHHLSGVLFENVFAAAWEQAGQALLEVS
jgi:xanthine dehydrogenase FAD-binding subunit